MYIDWRCLGQPHLFRAGRGHSPEKQSCASDASSLDERPSIHPHVGSEFSLTKTDATFLLKLQLTPIFHFSRGVTTHLRLSRLALIRFNSDDQSMPNLLPVRAFRSWMRGYTLQRFPFGRACALHLNHRLPGTLALAFRNTHFCRYSCISNP